MLVGSAEHEGSVTVERKRLLHDHEAARRGEFAAHHAAEVDAAREPLPAAVQTVPENGLPPTWETVFVEQRPHSTSSDIEDLEPDSTGLRQVERDGRQRIEWIRDVGVENRHSRHIDLWRGRAGRIRIAPAIARQHSDQHLGQFPNWTYTPLTSIGSFRGVRRNGSIQAWIDGRAAAWMQRPRVGAASSDCTNEGMVEMVMKTLSTVLGLSLVLASGIASPASGGTASIGVYFDPDCATCSTSATLGVPIVLYVNAHLGDGLMDGTFGAEFRVDGFLPTGRYST